MLHEIFPSKIDIGYKHIMPDASDVILIFDGERVSCAVDGACADLPKFSELDGADDASFIYVFSIDGLHYFINNPSTTPSPTLPAAYEMQNFGIFREIVPKQTAFAVATAQHLYQWYSNNKFCGCCGAGIALSQTERALVCSKCGLLEYPKISPCVIVGVTHGEFLLLTRYANREYRRYALIAGYVEIGESLEDTVRREVFEETGVRVKNIKYYGSQPWPFSSTLLSGFFCELDGDPAITMDENELSEAVWLQREAIPPAISDIALTSEMMERFRLGQI